MFSIGHGESTSWRGPWVDSEEPLRTIGTGLPICWTTSYGAAMSTFALIHGAWGVAREWDAVMGVLRRLGHDAIAVDMPIDDTSAGLEQQADCLVRATQHVEEPLVVVGHSAGGYCAALIPDRRPVRKLIFLAAFVPRPGKPFLVRTGSQLLDDASGCDFQLASPEFRSVIIDGNDGTCSLDPLRLAVFIVGEAAADMLVPMIRPLLRPHAQRLFAEPFPRAALPNVPCDYLLTARGPGSSASLTASVRIASGSHPH